jgi:hypothetical protein
MRFNAGARRALPAPTPPNGRERRELGRQSADTKAVAAGDGRWPGDPHVRADVKLRDIALAAPDVVGVVDEIGTVYARTHADDLRLCHPARRWFAVAAPEPHRRGRDQVVGPPFGRASAGQVSRVALFLERAMT